MIDDNRHVTPFFRRGLRGELPALVRDGMLTQEQAAALTARYALDALADESASRLMTAIYVIGSLLIGLGVITFVAFNWALMPAILKIVMLVAALIGAHTTGYYLAYVRASHPRLGHALILLGTFIFGANIFLIGQIIHIQSSSAAGFLLWAIGAYAVGVLLPSSAHLVFALATATVYFFSAELAEAPASFLFSLVVVLAFVPITLWRRAHVVHTFAILLAAVAFIAGQFDRLDSFEAFAWSALAVAALYTGYGVVLSRGDTRRNAAAATIAFGLIALTVVTYASSFHELADEFEDHSRLEGFFEWAAPVLVLFLMAAACWVLSFRVAFTNPRVRPIAIAGGIVIALMVAGLLLQNAMSVVLFANLGLLALCAGLVATGFTAERRLAFWGGVLLAGVCVFTRFLEYDTNLMLKSLAFLGSGVAVIVAGVVYEQYLRKRKKSHA